MAGRSNQEVECLKILHPGTYEEQLVSARFPCAHSDLLVRADAADCDGPGNRTSRETADLSRRRSRPVRRPVAVFHDLNDGGKYYLRRGWSHFARTLGLQDRYDGRTSYCSMQYI